MLITLVTTECTKRGNVKITKIISDLRDAIVDLKKVVLFSSAPKFYFIVDMLTTLFISLGT